jgi:acetyl esterase/lipase
VRFWNDDIEAMRPDAQRCVVERTAALRAAYNDRPPLAANLDRFERARAVRSSFPEFPAHAAGEDHVIDGVRCRVFAPATSSARAVYVHLHGGGMVLGTPEMNDGGNAALAERHGVAVVSVGYRTAPEDPHPAGIDDAVAVTQWVLAHAADELGAREVLLGGESAGAYLAVMTLLRLRDDGADLHRIRGAKLSYGVYDWGRPGATRRGALLDAGSPAFFQDCYPPERTDAERGDPSISPLHADLHGLVPAFVSVGTEDHLLDDSLGLAARWAAAGNDVELVVLPDLPHAFEVYDCGITAACATAQAEWFDARLAAASPVSRG